MQITDTALDGVKILEYDVHTDCRGYSFPILDRLQLREAGLDFDFSQEIVYHTGKAGTLPALTISRSKVMRLALRSLESRRTCRLVCAPDAI